MKLSIIIPLYNKEKYIARCLESLINQDLPKNQYEVVVVNDGSTDSSGSIASEFAEKHANIHVYQQENKGLSATRNRGLEIAKGDYVYFFDADDYIVYDVLKYLTDLCELNKLEILGFNTNETSDGTLTTSSTQKLQNLNLEVVDGIQYIAKHSYRNEVWWYFIKRSFLLDTGITFVVDRFMEDSIFTTNLFLKSSSMAKVDMDVHRFVKVENSVQTSVNPKHLLKFIHDIVFAIEEIDLLIKNLDRSHANYNEVVKDFRKKQQSYVFTLFIKAFRCPILSINDLKKILLQLKKLGVYPIDRKIGGVGNKKTRLIYDLTFIPFFNNKNLLFLGLKLNRLISSN